MESRDYSLKLWKLRNGMTMMVSGLKSLGKSEIAQEHNASVAKLIRRVVEMVYGEDIDDICDMEKEMAKYLANPDSAIDFDTYMRKRRAKVSR